MIYLLYGQPGAGKSTLGKLLADRLDTPFFIDGDEFRGMFANRNYSKKGREENIRNANAVATYLNKKGKDGDWKAIYIDVDNGWKSHPVNKETHVVVSLVNPYEHLRGELRENNVFKDSLQVSPFHGGERTARREEVVEILLESNRELRRKFHAKDFERGSPDYIISTDKDVETTWQELKQRLKL